MSPLYITLAVAAGGALGATGRYWIGVLASGMGSAWPVGTFTVNVVGSALIGFVVAHAGHLPHAHAFLVTGLLGGFTTYSAFALDTVHLAEAGRPILAALYVGATIVVCLASALAGVALGRATA